MYLISRSPYPFNADDIRADIGLEDRSFNPLIEAAIASIGIMSGLTLQDEVWAIVDGNKPFGNPTSKAADARQLPGTDRRMFRDYTYAADPRAVASVRADVARWCLDQDDICMALGAETRRAVLAPISINDVTAKATGAA